tara:strand:+ start:138 stop:572 length:435 start_codon:yes stop_codon:yes gene_type:complete
MNPLLIGPLLDIGKSMIDRIFPDKVEQASQRAQAELALVQLQQEGKFKETEQQLSAILAEANSSDPWTSRARPSFLYVVYILLLASIPMGVIYSVSPSTATDITVGFKAWLDAIPTEILELFKWVMLGYIGGRSLEKIKGVATK